MAATLQDISKVFGVSPVTISNAINSKKGVSQAKAVRIREYAKKVGYCPAIMATSLLKSRTNIVGVCLRGSVIDTWLSRMIQVIQSTLRSSGLHTIIQIAETEADVKWALDFFMGLRVDAVLLGPLGWLEEYNSLRDQIDHLPYVLAFEVEESLPIDNVRVDAYGGAEAAVEYLVKMGHRRIGYVGVKDREVRAVGLGSRYQGFCDTVRRCGLILNTEWLVRTKDVETDSLEVLLDKGSDLPTAWFCHGDMLAINVLKCLAIRGIRVPDDMSVIGFDNHPMTKMTTPEITSVGFDVNQYAQKLAGILADRTGQNSEFSGQHNLIHRERIAMYVVERNSVLNV